MGGGFNSASIGTLIAWNPGSGLVVCTLIPLKNVVMFLIALKEKGRGVFFCKVEIILVEFLLVSHLF